MPRGTPMDMQRVMALKNAGKSADEIAKETGYNVFSIYKGIRREKNNKGELRMDLISLDREGEPTFEMKRIEEKKEMEAARERIRGRRIDGTSASLKADKPHPDWDAPTFDAGLITGESGRKEETKPYSELTIEDVRETLVGTAWKYEVSSRDKRVVVSPRVVTDMLNDDETITIPFSAVEELARGLTELTHRIDRMQEAES